MIVQMDHPWTFPHNRGTITINTRNYRNYNVQLLMYNYTIDGNVNNMVYTARSRIFFSFFFYYTYLQGFSLFLFLIFFILFFFLPLFFTHRIQDSSHTRVACKDVFTWHNERKKKKMERLHSYIVYCNRYPIPCFVFYHEQPTLFQFAFIFFSYSQFFFFFLFFFFNSRLYYTIIILSIV